MTVFLTLVQAGLIAERSVDRGAHGVFCPHLHPLHLVGPGPWGAVGVSGCHWGSQRAARRRDLQPPVKLRRVVLGGLCGRRGERLLRGRELETNEHDDRAEELTNEQIIAQMIGHQHAAHGG